MVELHDNDVPPTPPPKSTPLNTMQSLLPSLLEKLPPRPPSKDDLDNTSTPSPTRNPVPVDGTMGTRMHEGPSSAVYVNNPSEYQFPEPSSTEVEEYSSYFDRSRTPSGDQRPIPPAHHTKNTSSSSTTKQSLPHPFSEFSQSSASQKTHSPVLNQSGNLRTRSPRIITSDTGDLYNPHSRSRSNGRTARHLRDTSNESNRSHRSKKSNESAQSASRPTELPPPLQYHHQRNQSEPLGARVVQEREKGSPRQQKMLGENLSRPASAFSLGSELAGRGRTRSPQLSPNRHHRNPSSHGTRSPDNRPISFVDLLNMPYPQPAPATNIDHTHLRTAVGTNASLLSTKKTLEMYRANVKKTNDPAIQYEFAIFMIDAAQEAAANGQDLGDTQRQPSPQPYNERDGSAIDDRTGGPNAQLLREARQILQRLSDKSYPFAQYYLADGYASGLFNSGKEDNDRAFPLFVAASKHGHAEAGYRAALCYEFGWGTRKDPSKAVQFYRQAASKNHPGSMTRLALACLNGELGLGDRYREGLKWLKRAAEAADFQYNSAPYELGLLHETGYGDDIFQDESYAAQLFTQSADLGHAEANYRLGDAYEHGKLKCPKDPALSVHFYTGAAQRGHPLAMMALCAWYMVGAEPVLEKDENEAYEWAVKAAEIGLPKAEYAVGYFTEMGIGCRRDPLEANVWYVRAADQGDERAKHRIAAIRDAASGGSLAPTSTPSPRKAKREQAISPGQLKASEEEKPKAKRWGIF
ncbi:hypothetical protein MMC13_006243 [Lambiella insularis]|nr:hypothetical protein [Lambiella insularis]